MKYNFFPDKIKTSSLLKTVIIICLMLCTDILEAQNKISFDLAAIRNLRTDLNGINVTCFYHFSEHVLGGIEMNRFFPVNRIKEDETVQLSAWDFDLNFHYLLSLNKHWKCYPLIGFSHTSEKEIDPHTDESIYDRFWSLNTGAGMLFELGKWSPHIEYNYTWGHVKQQFLLAGISYELRWGKHAGKEK